MLQVLFDLRLPNRIRPVKWSQLQTRTKTPSPNCRSEADSFRRCNPHIINREFTIIEVYKRQGSSPRLLFEPTLTGISSAVNGNHVLRGKVG